MANAVDDFDEMVVMNALRWKKERDEAREAARFFRDLYVSQVGRTYSEEYMLPWEAERDSDRNR